MSSSRDLEPNNPLQANLAQKTQKAVNHEP